MLMAVGGTLPYYTEVQILGWHESCHAQKDHKRIARLYLFGDDRPLE